ncbi:MAG: threonine/serine exporter family protein [Clostridium sp.]
MYIIKMLIASFFASLGFGVLFNIRGKKLILAGIAGSIGGVVYHVALLYGFSELSAMFLGSMALSLYSEILARVCKTPVTTFIICALIPLVPGGGMYRMMLQAIEGNVMQALTIGLDTLTIAGVLALGILVISTIMKAIFKPERKRVKRHEA